MRVEFLVPGVPQCKERPRVVRCRGGKVRTFTPAKTATYEQLVARCARIAGAKPVAGAVILRCAFYLPDARRRDLDNLIKSVADSLNSVCWVDDSQVVAVHAEKFVDRANPRAWVSVEVES